MNQLEILKKEYGIEQDEDLIFKKGGIKVIFYKDYFVEAGRLIMNEAKWNEPITEIGIYFQNNYSSYNEIIYDLWEKPEYYVDGKNTDDKINCIQKILLKIFTNADVYHQKAINLWTIKQIYKEQYFNLASLLKTPFNKHNYDTRFDKSLFLVYEVNYSYSTHIDSCKDTTDTQENFMIIKYDNNIVGDFYINNLLLPLKTKPNWTIGLIDCHYDEKVEILYRSDLTKQLQNRYDQVEHAKIFLQPISIRIIDDYKRQIKECFNSVKGNDSFVYPAERIILNFIELYPPTNEVVDMLFYFIEYGIDCFKNMRMVNENSYLEKNKLSDLLKEKYNSVLALATKNNLTPVFKERAKNVVREMFNVDELLYNHFNDVYFKIT